MDEWLDSQELPDRVHELIDMGLFDDAFELLEMYRDRAQDSAEIPFLYARIFLEQNKAAEAIPYLMQAFRLDSTNPDVLLGLFYANSQLGKTTRASRFLFRAFRHHPDTEQVLSAMIWYYTETNRFAQALACFEKARALGCGDPETFRNAGLTFQRVGDHQNAESCFRTALELNPAFEEVRDILADQYMMLDNTDKAVALYKDLLAQSPRNIRALSRLVFCLSQAGKASEAEALARETTRLYPNSSIGYVDLAYVQLNNDKPDLAVAAADQALQVSPFDAEALRVKAIALSEQNNTAEAEKLFTEAISQDPENPETLRDYYHHLRAVGEFEKMEHAVNDVIKMEQPYCVEDYWFLADYYRENKKNLKAFHYLSKAFKTMPGENELIPPMVDILLDEGHPGYAVPFLLAYVDRTGWNDTMNSFARHKRLRGNMEQESLRFLRYFSQKPVEFRRHILMVYAERYLPLALGLLLPFLGIFLYLLWEMWGVALAATLCLGVIIGFWAPKILARFGLLKAKKVPVEEKPRPEQADKTGKEPANQNPNQKN